MQFQPVKSPVTPRDFIKIIDQHVNNTASDYVTDDWGQSIGTGQFYFEVNYCLRKSSKQSGTVYELGNRKVFLFKESIVYPFVQYAVTKGGIIHFVEATGMSSL